MFEYWWFSLPVPKEWETLTTGLLAVVAAYATIYQMRISDKRNDDRHLELIALQFMPVHKKMLEAVDTVKNFDENKIVFTEFAIKDWNYFDTDNETDQSPLDDTFRTFPSPRYSRMASSIRSAFEEMRDVEQAMRSVAVKSSLEFLDRVAEARYRRCVDAFAEAQKHEYDIFVELSEGRQHIRVMNEQQFHHMADSVLGAMREGCSKFLHFRSMLIYSYNAYPASKTFYPQSWQHSRSSERNFPRPIDSIDDWYIVNDHGRIGEG
ncbi:hypothetical protein [Aureimonas leprariae]|uniref:hypothetical protein n=1 Tax=Plantimonas leprariae TaxID=2615207 RepID=UPI00124758DA|nr:hypothetical protein [Aureimonas leprariae]